MILNLGCGREKLPGAVNCDIMKAPGVINVDLSVFPWPWADESIDGIHASHVIEHFRDQEKFILECYRILKKGGYLRLKVPHSSNSVCVGCMGHYRTYSYNTFKDYLSTTFYMFGRPIFKTVEQKINWWFEFVCWNDNVPKPLLAVIVFVNPIINFFINLSPAIFENLWCYWIGGAREVIWKGVKM